MRALSLAAMLSVSPVWGGPLFADLEPGQTWRLDRALAWPGGYALERGTTVRVNDVIPLGGIPVVLVETTMEPCLDSALEIEMEIFAVPAEVGIDITPGCRLSIYLETSDFYSPAPLE